MAGVDLETFFEGAVRHSWSERNGVLKLVTLGTNTTSAMPAGVYDVSHDMTGPVATPIDLKKEKLLNTGGALDEVIREVEKFWELKDMYTQMGLSYRRGVLLYGQPGNGKSSLVRMVAQDVVSKGGIVILSALRMVISWMPVLKKTEEGRRIVIILEDIDGIVDYGNEEELLELLDGTSSALEGVLFIATTNNLESIPKRALRPSRFDTIIEIKKPSADQRRMYAKEIIDRSGIQMDAKTISEITENFSLAEVKELITACAIFGRDPISEVKRLKKHASLGKAD